MHSRSIFYGVCCRCHRRFLPEVARESLARRLLVVYARRSGGDAAHVADLAEAMGQFDARA